MRCVNCGTENPEQNRFCVGCGQRLSGPSASAAASTMPDMPAQGVGSVATSSPAGGQSAWSPPLGGLDRRALTASVGELVKGVIALVLIPVFVGVVQGMPEVASQRLGDIGASTLVRAGGALLSVIVLVLMWSPAGTTVAQVILGLYRGMAAPASEQAARDFGQGVAALMVLFGAYSFGMGPLREVLFNSASLNWVPTAVTVALLAAALIILIQLYQGLGPVIEGVASRKTAEPPSG